jgi:predicted  nucleic acid-binding Zn-ribbon protein
MSTLKVATIQDTSGNNSSTPAGIASGTAKAWLNFNGAGTIAIRDSFNVASITDNGTGDYTINFTNAFTDADYVVVANSATADSDYRIVVPNFNASPTTSACRIRAAVPSSSGPATDDKFIHIAVFR